MTNLEQDNSINDSGEISLKEFILKLQDWYGYVLSKWKLIVMIGLVGGALGLAYAYFKRPIYKAEVSFALEDEKSGGAGLGAAIGLASQFGFDFGNSNGGGAFSGDNLLELMKSRSMVESTLLSPININGKKQTLAETYISFNKLRKKWDEKQELRNLYFSPNGDRSKFTLTQDSVLGEFYKEIIKNILSVDKMDKKLSIITVKVNSENELFSKYFAEILTKTVADFYIITKTKKSVQNVTILQRQTDSIRRELNSAITGVASSADVNPNANPTLQILRTPSQKRQVDVQANTAILTQLVTNLEISKVSLRKETPLIQIIDRPILPLEKERAGKLKSLIIGGLLAVFFSVVVLSFIRLYRKLMI